ncbi:MAG: AmmeMemoRadiSam system radical SAM enzyme [Candidatus Nitronauta litoralis]|uniref:AmmeMemoRadiSam system radical SAM enzyme n=1 Tax=Candidatus Nitronauta litoralis TaxID=2705533 RepID=A0A7T0BTR9_9BACT|nr:MAG: AmmeMemoRadiSam system radical SAM enzyme [Candidatus Nitronauta litoralis]
MAPILEKISLDNNTRPGELVRDLSAGRLLCTACGHLCELKAGQRGVCKVRFNEDGVLKVPAHYAAGVHNDPIEKKPFFHALPGSRALSFGMLGCDFKCAYCQNWFTSQTLRDEASTQNFTHITAEELCSVAKREGAQTIVSTYNEPLITSEWAVEVFQEARRQGLNTAYVSNGHGTPEVIEYIRPFVDFYKVDLKCFDEKNYRKLGGSFEAVLDTIKHVQEAGMWLEVVTLVIPDYNDSERELSSIAEFLADVSCDIPWHVTAFHPDYKMTDRGRTPVETLLRAYDCGKKAGLNFVYCGNLPGQTRGLENTCCPGCNAVLIERVGFRVHSNRLKNGHCPDCGKEIPGRW